MDYYNPYGSTSGGTAVDVDLTGVEPWEDNGRTLVPAGTYPVTISKCQFKTAKTGSRCIAMTYTITDGQYAKRCLFEDFYLWSSNPQVAKQHFKALRRALGLNENVGGTLEELLGREFLAVVKTRESKRNNAEPGERENFISAYRPMQQGSPAAAPVAPVAQMPTAAPAVAPMPAAAPQAAPVQRAAVQQPLVQQQPAPAAQPSESYPW